MRQSRFKTQPELWQAGIFNDDVFDPVATCLIQRQSSGTVLLEMSDRERAIMLR